MIHCKQILLSIKVALWCDFDRSEPKIKLQIIMCLETAMLYSISPLLYRKAMPSVPDFFSKNISAIYRNSVPLDTH